MHDDSPHDGSLHDELKHTVASARQAADAGDLNEWVARFLASPGSDNAALGHELTNPPRIWSGPIQLPLDRLHRLAGPPGDPVLQPTDEDDWRDDVDDLAESIEEEELEPPPVIVTYRDDQFVLEDGNHRVEAIRRAGTDVAWAVISFESDDERDRLVQELRELDEQASTSPD